MMKVSKLLKVTECQHCVAHAVNLLLMTDSLLKVQSIMVLVKKCKDIVTTLHFKCDLLEQEGKDTNNEVAANKLIEKIKEVQMLEDIGIGNDGDDEIEHSEGVYSETVTARQVE